MTKLKVPALLGLCVYLSSTLPASEKSMLVLGYRFFVEYFGRYGDCILVIKK